MYGNRLLLLDDTATRGSILSETAELRYTKHSEVALYLRNYMQLKRGRLLRKTIPFSSVGNTNVIDAQSREVGRQVGAQNNVKMKYTCTSKRTPLQSSYPLHAVVFGGKLVTRQYEHRSL